MKTSTKVLIKILASVGDREFRNTYSRGFSIFLKIYLLHEASPGKQPTFLVSLLI